MEHLKKRLYLGIAMLVVSAVMLTGASYAWITLSTNPEISNVLTRVAGNQNLEIALDDGYSDMSEVDLASANANIGGNQGSTAGNPYTWGNYIDLTKVFKDQLVILRQVKFSANPIKMETAVYDVDGRVESLVELQSKVMSNYEGAGTKGGIKYYSTQETVESYYAYSISFWLRTNVTGDVSLSEAAKRANDGTGAETGVNGQMGKGSYISVPLAGNGPADVMDRYMSNMRLVFVDETTSPQILFEASICSGTSDGSARTYKLVTSPSSAGANPVYVSDLEGGPIHLTEYEAKKITMYVYLDGEEITNSKAFLYELTGVEINVQFDNSAIVDDTADSGAMTGETTGNSAYTNGVAN